MFTYLCDDIYENLVVKSVGSILFSILGPSSSFIYCISTVNTQHMRRPDVLVQLCYIWRHISAVNRPSSGQQRIVSLRYRQIVCTVGSLLLQVVWMPIRLSVLLF